MDVVFISDQEVHCLKVYFLFKFNQKKTKDWTFNFDYKNRIIIIQTTIKILSSELWLNYIEIFGLSSTNGKKKSNL